VIGLVLNGVPYMSNPFVVRDVGPYSARNSSKGALVVEAWKVLTAIGEGRSVEEIHQAALKGTVLTQRSRNSRERIWELLSKRYPLAQGGWIRDALVAAAGEGVHTPTFLGLLYVHYVLRDRLTFDVVVDLFWPRWLSQNRLVSRDDVLGWLAAAAEHEPQVRRWSESSRAKVAGNVLTALRDFGLLEGRQRKRLVQPPLTDTVVGHVLRLLVQEGQAGNDILRHSTWRLFLLDERDASTRLARIADGLEIRFERGWSETLVQTPSHWRDAR
jgi:hypothetical protein